MVTGGLLLSTWLPLGLAVVHAQPRPSPPASLPELLPPPARDNPPKAGPPSAALRPQPGPPPEIDGPSEPPSGDAARQTPSLEGLPPLVAPPAVGDEPAPAGPPFTLSDPGILGDEVELFGPEFAPLTRKLNPYKNSFFQKISLAADWLGNSADPADLGLTEVDTYLQVGLPAPLREWPLLVTAGWNLTLIDGPTVTDLPPRLYLAYVDLMWLPQVVRGYTLLFSVVPSVFGDFQAHDFRLTGKGLLIYDWVPQRLQLLVGVLYLNRENLRLLPAGGAIWTPEDWLRLELIFPKPKFAFRYHAGYGFEDWIYATAEFGGNTWPIERSDGTLDRVTYLDYRLLIGTERKMEGGAGYRLEAGYVFGRDISFLSGRGDFAPQDSFMLRGGITY